MAYETTRKGVREARPGRVVHGAVYKDHSELLDSSNHTSFDTFKGFFRNSNYLSIEKVPNEIQQDGTNAE